jgi:hypothetical protein
LHCRVATIVSDGFRQSEISRPASKTQPLHNLPAFRGQTQMGEMWRTRVQQV